MVNQIESRPSVARGAGSAAADIDQGLRSYMLGVYNYMSSGVLLTGLVALFVGTSQPAQALIFGTPLRYVALFAPLAIVLVMSFGINRLSATATKTLFWVYAATMGLSLGSIFLIYTGSSIARVFFISAATFGALSLYGYTTKKDLSGFGTFLIMGLFGLIIASIVNIFLKSTMMEFVLSVVSVLIFAGLTAYDTQKIKLMYFAGDMADTVSKKIVMGALSLYLDFINLFLSLLRLFGANRD